MICPYTGLKCNWFCEICSIAEEQSEYYPKDTNEVNESNKKQ